VHVQGARALAKGLRGGPGVLPMTQLTLLDLRDDRRRMQFAVNITAHIGDALSSLQERLPALSVLY
jgi:hypothetical protein